MSEIGNYIRQQRTTRGFSFNDLGEKSGISGASIQKIESGKTKHPQWENLCAIAKALDIHPFEMMKVAGYITEKDINPIHRLKKLDALNDEEINLLQSYIDFLFFRKKSVTNRKDDIDYDL